MAAPTSKTSWLRRLSRLSVIAVGATAGIGVALWLLPEEEDGDEGDSFFVKDASSPFVRSGVDFDDDDNDDEDSVFHRRRRHHRTTFASKPLQPPSPPSFLAQLTVGLFGILLLRDEKQQAAGATEECCLKFFFACRRSNSLAPFSSSLSRKKNSKKKQDTLERAGENAARGGRAARTLAKAAARDGLLFPPLPLSKGGRGGGLSRSSHGQHSSSSPLLSAVASWTSDPKTRRALADAGGTSLGAWLLDAAAAAAAESDDGSGARNGSREAAEGALARLLLDPSTAPAVPRR